MGSTFWVAIAVVAVVSIIANAVVKIIHAAKSGPGKGRMSDFESDMAALEQDLADARERIEVLEKIVTDEKYDLGRQIDELNEKKSG